MEEVCASKQAVDEKVKQLTSENLELSERIEKLTSDLQISKAENEN